MQEIYKEKKKKSPDKKKKIARQDKKINQNVLILRRMKALGEWPCVCWHVFALLLLRDH